MEHNDAHEQEGIIRPRSDSPVLSFQSLPLAPSTAKPAEVQRNDNNQVTAMLTELLEAQQRTSRLFESLLANPRASTSNIPTTTVHTASVNVANPANTDSEVASVASMVPEQRNGEKTKGPSTPGEWKEIALSLAANQSHIRATAPDKPSFSGCDNTNPVRFLNNFEQYYALIQTRRTNKLTEVIACLARKAEDWALFHLDSWVDFDNFRVDFLRHFWSEERQQEARHWLLSRPYDPNRGCTMSEFFICIVNEIKTMSLPLPETMLLRDILRLFPFSVQSLWTVLPKQEKNLKGTLEFLELQSLIVHPKRPKLETSRSISSNSIPKEKSVSSTVTTVAPFSPFSVPPPKPPMGNDRRTR